MKTTTIKTKKDLKKIFPENIIEMYGIRIKKGSLMLSLNANFLGIKLTHNINISFNGICYNITNEKSNIFISLWAEVFCFHITIL